MLVCVLYKVNISKLKFHFEISIHEKLAYHHLSELCFCRVVIRPLEFSYKGRKSTNQNWVCYC